MLHSKLHRPWKPRMSGSLPLTSFSHGPESEADSTFTEDLDTEREAISEPIAQEVAEFMSSAEISAPQATSPDPQSRWKRWYMHWRGNFAKH